MNSSVEVISLLKLNPEWKSIRLKTEKIIIKKYYSTKKTIGLEPAQFFITYFI